MAEFLIYNKEHWMDSLTEEQIKEYIAKRPKFLEGYEARYQRGDVVEVRPDGYWTGEKAKKYRKDAFLMVSVPGISFEEAKQYQKPLTQEFPVSVWNKEINDYETDWVRKTIKTRRFNFGELSDKQEFGSLSQITITDKIIG